jgi:hypothetical protein
LKRLKITVKKVDTVSVDNFIKLARIEYGNKDTVTQRDHIIWKHLATANGPSTSVNLQHDQKVVGRILLQPTDIYIKGRKIDIAFAVDSLVHPAFRRPFSNFLSIIKEIKNVKEFAFVLHTSNENTEGIYKSILKLDCPISLSGYGLPINIRNIAKKFLGFKIPFLQFINYPIIWTIEALFFLSGNLSKLNISPKAPGNQVHNEFLLGAADLNEMNVLHNLRFLKWRFEESPLWKADIQYIYRGSVYLGYIVLRHIELEGLRFTVVMDFSVHKNITKIQKIFIRMYIVKQALMSCDDVVFMLFNSKAKSVKRFLGFPFIHIPDKYLPHKTPFFMHVVDTDVDVKSIANLNITLADIDYF